jgi:hypothetical protein
MFAVSTGVGRYFDESEPLGNGAAQPASVAIVKAATVSLISEFILGSFAYSAFQRRLYLIFCFLC